jgi:hypothetical protein
MEAPTPYKKATEQDTMKIFNAIWYTVAQRIVERIIEVSQLDEDRAAALRRSALRPMDFQVIVE